MDGGCDVAVVGAGVIGCAVAAELARRGLGVWLLEREAKEGTGVTSRNSGVVHGGLYYPPGSRKARTCIRGNAMLYAWARAHGVGHRMLGKLVVARTREEVDALERLHQNARVSGAEGVSMISGERVRALEPDLPEVRAALYCERSGIVDAHELTRSLMVAAERDGATVITQASVESIDSSGDGFVIVTARGPVRTSAVVNAAGLHADDIARMVGLDRYTVYPYRGDYFRLHTKARYRHLVYPVRPAGIVGLGVHLTIDLSGAYLMGPDSELVESKEDFSPAEHKTSAFLESSQRLLGPLEPDQLRYDSCGLRPTLRAPGSNQDVDFVVEEHPKRCVHLLGIESPGLTSALALARETADLLTDAEVPR